MPSSTFSKFKTGLVKKVSDGNIDTRYIKPTKKYTQQYIVSGDSVLPYIFLPSEEFAESKNQQSIENQLNIARLNEYLPQTAKLLQLIKDTDFEYGINTPVDDFLRQKLQQNAAMTKQWLAHIFLSNNKNPAVLVGILRTIAHLTYNEMYPNGMIIAQSAICHENFEVKECGIRAFENWGTRECLETLQTVDVADPRLKIYLSEVIQDLKEVYK